MPYLLQFRPQSSINFQKPVLPQITSKGLSSFHQHPSTVFQAVQSGQCAKYNLSQAFRLDLYPLSVLKRPHSDLLVQSVERSTYHVKGQEDKYLDRTNLSSVDERLRASNTVGILGGISTVATANFMKRVVQAALEDDANESIPLLVSCGTHWKPKTSREIAGQDPSRICQSSPQLPISSLVESRVVLEQSGAKCIVLPCHISHMWYDKIAHGSSVPVLHIADCLAEELNSLNLRPIEIGSRPKIGLLGTEATVKASFYQRKLTQMGFEIILSDRHTMEHAVLPGIKALEREDMEGARNLLRIAVQLLLVNSVNMVVLACHDMASVFPQEDPLLKKCIDPIDSLSRATVKWARKHRNL